MMVEQTQNSQHLQILISDIDNARALLSDYLHNRKEDAVALLNLNGIAISPDASMKSVRVAILKALKDSDNFRTQLSQILSDYISSFSNESSSKEKSYNWFGNPDAIAAAAASNSTDTTGSGTTSTPDSSTTKGFWGTLGTIFTPSVIQEGVKTGLTAISTSIQSKANQGSEQNALALEQLKLAQIQAQTEANKTVPTKPGISTAWKIVIAAVSVILVGGVIILIVRKK